MNLSAIRSDIAAALLTLGYNAYGWIPEDIQALPAAVAGVPATIEPRTMTAFVITLPITLYVSLANAQDAQQRLDTALSTGIPGSVYDALKALQSTAWQSIRITGAGNIRPVTIGNSTAVAADINVEIIS